MPNRVLSEEEKEKQNTLEKLKLLEQKVREMEKIAINAKKNPTRTDAEEAAYAKEREQVIDEIVKDFRKNELNENMGYNQWVDAMLLLLNLFSAFAKAMYVLPPLPLRQLGLFSTRHENPVTLTELVQYVASGIASIPGGNIKSLAAEVGNPKDPSPRAVEYALEFANNGQESLGRVSLFSKDGPMRAFVENYKTELLPPSNILLKLVDDLLKKLTQRKPILEVLPEIETAFLTCLIEWVNTQPNLGNNIDYRLSLEKQDKDPQNPNDLMDDVYLRMDLLKPEEANLPPEERLVIIQRHQKRLMDALELRGENSFDNFLHNKIKDTNIALTFAAKEPMPLPAPAPRP